MRPEGLLAIDTLGPPIHAKAFKSIARKTTKKHFNRQAADWTKICAHGFSFGLATLLRSGGHQSLQR
jgi:hypothetical protein